MKADILVSGWHSVGMSLLKNPQLCKEIWVSCDLSKTVFKDHEERIISVGLKVQFVDRKTLNKIHGNSSHHGVVLRRIPPELVKIKDCLKHLSELENRNPLILVLDRIQDPRNFGACLRVAACVGVDAVIYPNSNSANITSVVAQAASGAIDLVSLVRVSNLSLALRQLSSVGIWLIGSDEGSGVDFYDTNLKLPTAIIVGNEGVGIRHLTKTLCDLVVSLPASAELASLNVASATAAMLYEALRQRTR